MYGYRALGLFLREQRRCGFGVTGCAEAAAGCGSQVTGSNGLATVTQTLTNKQNYPFS